MDLSPGVNKLTMTSYKAKLAHTHTHTQTHVEIFWPLNRDISTLVSWYISPLG